VRICFLHRLTESKKSLKHKKSFLRERVTKKVHHKNFRSYKKSFYGTQRKFSEATKSRSTEHSVSLPKLQKVVPKVAQCKFSAQKSFQRECRAYSEKSTLIPPKYKAKREKSTRIPPK
jgi:predicted nucleotidyltransferase